MISLYLEKLKPLSFLIPFATEILRPEKLYLFTGRRGNS